MKNLFEPGTAKYNLLTTQLSGRYRNRKLYLKDTSGDDSESWEISVDCKAKLKFQTLSESSQSLEKSLGFPNSGILGVGRDDQVQDPELDERFVFRSSDPGRFAVWVRDPQIKECFRKLASYSCVINLENQEIQFYLPKPNFMGAVEMVANQLVILAESIEANFGYYPGEEIPKKTSQVDLVRILLLFFLIAGGIALLIYILTRI